MGKPPSSLLVSVRKCAGRTDSNFAQTALEEITAFLAAHIHHEFNNALSVCIYISLCVCPLIWAFICHFQVFLKAFEVSWPEKIRHQGEESYFKNFKIILSGIICLLMKLQSYFQGRILQIAPEKESNGLSKDLIPSLMSA